MAVPELKRILYVDDDEDISTIARLALERFGQYQVEMCVTGEEAVEKAPAFCPDLILLDVVLPGMDGPSTLKAMRENPELVNTTLVFMTAKTQDEELRGYRELGAAGVITKPFDPVSLSAQVAEIWDHAHA